MDKLVNNAVLIEDSTNLRSRAYERFLDALRSGKLALGQMVSQKKLASDLELSVGTLRELLPRLESEGLVQVLNQRGILLPAIDLTMIRETFQLRMALEREAVLAAVEYMSGDEIDSLYQRHVDTIESIKNDASESILSYAEKLDRDMHETLIKASKNKLLERTYTTNTTRMRLIKLYRHALTPQTMIEALSDHLAIIDALKKRDRLAAMDAMETHIRNARERAVRL